MTEIASLMIEVDATAVERASQSLDKLGNAAGRLEASLHVLVRSARESMAGFLEVTGGAVEMVGAVQEASAQMGGAFQEARSKMEETSEATGKLEISFELAIKATLELSLGAKDLGESAKGAARNIDGAGKAADNVAEKHGKAAAAAGLQTKEVIKLTKSFLGLGGAILSGENPLKALAAHLPDIVEVFMEASARGVSFKDALISLGEQYGLLRKVGGGQAADALKSAAAFEAQASAAMEAALAQGDLSVAVMAGATSAAPAAMTGAAGITAANEEIAATAVEAAAAEAIALAPLALIAAGIALTVGTIAAGFSLAAFEMNRHTKGLNDNLGLTQEQLDRIKNKSVTAGDVMHGVWNLAAGSLKKALGPAIDDIKEKFGQWLDDTINNTVNAGAALAAVFVGAFDAVKAVWGMLPAAFGDLIIQSVNHILGGFNKVLQFILPKLNPLIEMANRLSAAAGHPLNIKPFDVTADFIKQLDNPFAGARDKTQKTLRDTFTASFSKHFAEFRGAIIAAADAAIAAIVEAHRQRMRDEGGKPTPKPPASPSAATAIPKSPSAGDDDAVAANRAAGLESIATGAGVAASSTALLRGEMDRLNKILAAGSQALGQTGDALTGTSDRLTEIALQGQVAAKGMAQAFGDVGKSLGDMLNLYNNYAQRQAQFAKDRQKYASGEAADADKLAQVNRDAADAQKQYYGDVLQAAEGMVDKKSNAYQALIAAEKIYRAFQFAMSVKAAVQSTMETATQIANDQAGLASKLSTVGPTMAADTAVAGSGMAAGAGKIFAALGPLGFPVVAAMVAVMASLGFGSAGGSHVGEQDAERRQKAQRAGSVLGDSEAKSESIQKALELVADHTNDMLEFYNPMLAALRSIDGRIGAVASALARSLGVGGMLDTSKLGLGTSVQKPGMGAFLGAGLLSQLLPGLFSTKVTKTLQDQGLQFSAGTLASILSGGVQGKTYAQILTETKKSFFGLTYSDSTSNKTVLGSLDPDFARQTTLLIGSLRDGVVTAASTLGIEGAAATLEAFRLDLGKISLKGLKGEEITKALEAVFGKAADQMAAAVMPGLEKFQKVGEGAFETLTRLARDYQVVDVTLKSIGKMFGAVGVASLEARERLVELSGGLDNLTEQTGFYAENFLDEAERLAPVQAAVSAELTRLGLSGVKTRDQFKTVVQGLDVSTEAGAKLFAALMTLAPAFAAVTEESEALSNAKEALSSAYERESGALQDTHDRFSDLALSLKDFEVELHNGPAAALSPEDQYRAAQAAFRETAGLAAQGNEQALGDLQNVSQAYLEASRAYYASSEGYFADLSAVRDAVAAAETNAEGQADLAQRQLDVLTQQVGQLIELNSHVISVAEAIAALRLLMGGEGARPIIDPALPPKDGPASNDNAVVAAIQDLQTEMAEQLAADKTQRAAIADQQNRRLSAVEDQIAALRRAAQA